MGIYRVSNALVRMMFGWTEISMRNCYYSNVGYIFIERMEAWMIVAMAIDRHLAISCPIVYRTWNLNRYIVWMCIPGVFNGLFFSISSVFWLTDDLVNPCVIPYAMPPNVSEWWNKSTVALCLITVVIYISTYIRIYIMFPLRKGSSNLSESQIKTQKKVFTTIIVQVCVFFFANVMSALIILGITAMGASEDAIIDATALAVIPGLLGYSCNFYVHLWRSTEHREAFIRLFTCGKTNRKPSQSTSVRTITVTQTRRTQSEPVLVTTW